MSTYLMNNIINIPGSKSVRENTIIPHFTGCLGYVVHLLVVASDYVFVHV